MPKRAHIDEDRARRMLDEGKTLTEVAKKEGCSIVTLTRRLNLPKKKRGVNLYVPEGFSAKDDKDESMDRSFKNLESQASQWQGFSNDLLARIEKIEDCAVSISVLLKSLKVLSLESEGGDLVKLAQTLKTERERIQKAADLWQKRAAELMEVARG